MTSLPLSPIKYQDQRDSLVNSINHLRKNNHTNLIYMGIFLTRFTKLAFFWGPKFNTRKNYRPIFIMNIHIIILN